MRKKAFCFFAVMFVFAMAFAVATFTAEGSAANVVAESTYTEIEDNNTASKASSIAFFGEEYSGVITDYYDTDWYKLEITERGHFNVTFRHDYVEARHTWYFRVYDADMCGIGSSSRETIDVYGTAVTTITNEFGVDVGTYYVQIDSSNSGAYGVNYTVKVDFTATDDWEIENNNERKLANEISVNKKYYGVTTAGLPDWFKFTTYVNGYFTFDFATDSSVGGRLWYLYIYNSENVQMPCGNNINRPLGSGKYSTEKFGAPAGTYYIHIDPYSSDCRGIIYDFKVNFTQTEDFELELNNDSSAANTISVNKTVGGVIAEENEADWFVFTVDHACEVAIAFAHTGRVDNYFNASLYASDKTKIGGVSAGENSVESQYYSIGSGTYYVSVSAGYYHTNAEYTIKVIEKHEHAGVWEQKLAPTCTTEGEEHRICTICGNLDKRPVSALGHKFDEGVITREATVFKKGEIQHTCTVCKEKQIEADKSKVWILPVIIVGAVVVAIGLVNYIRMMKKKD